MAFALGQVLAVNGKVVIPFQHTEEDIKDPDGLLASQDFQNLERVKLSSVHLSGGGGHVGEHLYAWIESALLIKRGKRLVSNCALLREIKQGLKAFRLARGRSVRLPVGKEDIVPLRIRNHIALFKNDCTCIVFYMLKQPRERGPLDPHRAPGGPQCGCRKDPPAPNSVGVCRHHHH